MTPLRTGWGDTGSVGGIAGSTSCAPPRLRAPSTWSSSSFCLKTAWAATNDSRAGPSGAWTTCAWRSEILVWTCWLAASTSSTDCLRRYSMYAVL